MWRIAGKLAKVVAFLLVAVALVYLVGINVFLRTRLFRDAAGADPESLLIDYSSAYSVWPGRIHADALSIRGRDHHVEWILRLDRCDFQVSFMDLAHQKFHVDHVRGDGVSLRVRRRVEDITVEAMSALPPIPGFDYPPLVDVGPPDEPLTDATYDLWSIELDDVLAQHVTEVWIDTLRYTGELQIRGRWNFRPLRWLDVGPATIEANPLEVSFGTSEPWLSSVVGRLEVTVHPFDLVTVPSADIVDQVSVRGDLAGTAHVATLVNRVMESEKAEVTHADAPFELHAQIDHGVLGPGTQVRTEPFDARGKAEGLSFEGSWQANVRVGDDDVAYADFRVTDAAASAGGEVRARAASLAVTLTSLDLDLAKDPFSNPAYAVDVTRAESDSLAYWASRLPLPTDIHLASGAVTANGRLQGVVRQKTGRGQLALGVKRLSVDRANARVEGDVRAEVHLDGSLETKRVELTGGEVSLRDVRATAKGLTVEVPSLEARAKELIVSEAGVTGRISVDAPVVGLPSLSAVGALLPLPKDIVIEGGRGSARVRMDVDVAELSGEGEMAMAARNLRLRVGAQRLQGDLSVVLTARRSGAGAVDLSGSQIAFQSAGAPDTLDWWGRLRLRQATLSIRPGLRFRTFVSAAFKDGSPLTALVADNTAIPQWVIDAVSTKGLEATGELRVTPSLIAVRSVEAHAEGADVGFEFGKIGQEKKEWAMLLDLGAVMAGVDVADGHTQVLLFGARPWFRAKVASLEAVEQRSE